MDAGRLLEDLDPDQRRAVVADPLPTLVMAGAGSGKTRVLTYRIAYQIATGIVEPRSVMASTFTKNAAAEMRDRVETLLGRGAAPAIATFHSLMFRLLNNESELRGGRRLDVCRESDRTRMLRGLVGRRDQEFPEALNLGDVDVKELGAWISSCKNTLVHADDDYVRLTTLECDAETVRGAAARVYPLYEARLAAAGKLDFDDMLLHAYDLLAGDDDALRRCQRRWLAFFVDEAQDLNTAQWRIVQLVAPATNAPNLTVVGDSKQALYGFRGAQPDLMDKFDQMYPSARRFDLVMNYRSTPQVIRAANTLIAVHGHPAQVPSRDGGVTVRAAVFADQVEQGVEVARFVEAMRAGGHRGGECAVLVRTNAQTAQIERNFVAAGLPYYAGGGGFLNRLEVGDLMAYLRLAHDREDTLSLRRIINRPTRYLGAAYVDALAHHAAGGDLVDSMRTVMHYSGKAMTSRQVDEAMKLADLLDAVRTMRPATAIREVLTSTNYVKWLRKNEGVEAAADDLGVENLEALLELAAEFATIPELLAYAVEAATLLQESGDATELCTVHRAKGREWPFVIVSNFYDGSFPHKSALNPHEERRIAYVAWTRARDALLITVPGEDLYGREVDESPYLAAGGVTLDEPGGDWWGDALLPNVTRDEMVTSLTDMARRLA